jgi:hypothetical protein
MTDTRDLCKSCGATIYAVEMIETVFGDIESRRDHCEACCYLHHFNREHLVKPPWKVPMPRPTPAGTIPKVIQDHIALRRAEQDARRAKKRSV